MTEKLKQFKCGACGNDEYRVYGQEYNDVDIFTECTECKSVTRVTISPATLRLRWYGKSDGIMCYYD